MFGGAEVSLSPSDKSNHGNKSRKRIFSEDDSKQGYMVSVVGMIYVNYDL